MEVMWMSWLVSMLYFLIGLLYGFGFRFVCCMLFDYRCYVSIIIVIICFFDPSISWAEVLDISQHVFYVYTKIQTQTICLSNSYFNYLDQPPVNTIWLTWFENCILFKYKHSISIITSTFFLTHQFIGVRYLEPYK